MTSDDARRGAALELWSGICLAIGSILPRFTYEAGEGTLHQSGTNVLWGALPFFGGWWLAVTAAKHIHANAPANRRLLAPVIALGIVALVGAVLVAIPMDTQRGLRFQSFHIGFIVSIVGVVLGIGSLLVDRRR